MTFYQKFFLVFFLTVASVVATCLGPYVVIIGKLFHTDISSLSKLMSFYLTGCLAGQFVFSKFSKKYNGLLSVKLGLMVGFFGLYLQVIAFHLNIFLLFLIGRFIAGLGLSAGLIIGFAIIKDNIAPKTEKLYLSIIAMAFTLTIYLSILASGYLSKILSINTFFYILMAYILFLMPLTFYLPNTKKNTKKSNLKIKWNDFFNIKLINYSLVLSLTTLIAYLYAFYGPLIFVNKFGFSTKEFSKLNLINMSGVFLGSFFYPKLSKYINEKVLINFILVMIILNMFYILKLGDSNYIGFIIIFFITNIFSGLLYPASTYLALGCGVCKTSTSTTMNIIKTSIPIIGFYFSSILKIDVINKLASTIIIFTFCTVILMQYIFLLNTRFFNKKISQ